jgi:hypothetical protein
LQELQAIRAWQPEVCHEKVWQTVVMLAERIGRGHHRADSRACRFERVPEQRQRLLIVVDQQNIDATEDSVVVAARWRRRLTARDRVRINACASESPCRGQRIGNVAP